MNGGCDVPEKQVILLRAINVGGKNKLSMAEVSRLMEKLGAADAVTYLQTGNVLTSSANSRIHLELAEAIRAECGLDLDIFRFTSAELTRIVQGTPFPHKVGEPKNLHVAFLGEAPDTAWFEAAGLSHDGDELALGEREIYLSYQMGSRNSPLAKVLRNSRLCFTARNWTTVCKLQQMALAA
jgi:uncharacterized protein (DUF1697 family)